MICGRSGLGRAIRSEIVADARLRDLRRAHASRAVMNSESLHVAGRMLGHFRAGTTNRYTHLYDATLSQAVEQVAVAIARKLYRRANHEPESYNSYRK